MRVHLFNEKYIQFLRHFESPKAEKEWRDFLIQNPEREACPGVVTWRALMLGLDKLEPDLAEAESQRVQLELLNQKLRQHELQKNLLQGQAVAHYSEIAEVLQLPNTMIEMLTEKKDTLFQQMRKDSLDIRETLETVITKEMMKGRGCLKGEVRKETLRTCKETDKEVVTCVSTGQFKFVHTSTTLNISNHSLNIRSTNTSEMIHSLIDPERTPMHCMKYDYDSDHFRENRRRQQEPRHSSLTRRQGRRIFN